jgi:arsenate reductase
MLDVKNSRPFPLLFSPLLLMSKPKVLFLCTGNSCRSQMAEGWCRHLHGDQIEAYSAGVETHGLNPNAIKVMAEVGIDITGHQSQLVTDLDVEFDVVLSVCDHAKESCPVLPSATRQVHHSFPDPPRLAKEAIANGMSEEESLGFYRSVRDEIKTFLENIHQNLGLS